MDGDFYILEKKMGKWGKYKAKRMIYVGMGRVLEKEKGRFFIWRNNQKMTHFMALLINKRI